MQRFFGNNQTRETRDSKVHVVRKAAWDLWAMHLVPIEMRLSNFIVIVMKARFLLLVEIKLVYFPVYFKQD